MKAASERLQLRLSEELQAVVGETADANRETVADLCRRAIAKECKRPDLAEVRERGRPTILWETTMEQQHDVICKAFENAGAKICYATDVRRYSHVHTPTKPPRAGARSCTTHCVVVEKFNGTVRIQNRRVDLAASVGGTVPHASGRISAENPLGFSAGPAFGRFEQSLSYAQILERWGTPEKFVRHVVACCCQTEIW